MGKNVYEIVTERICGKIETAIKNNQPLPWQKPWVWANAPKNYLGNEYRGINALLLDEGEYITWNQICDLQKHNKDIKLKKGCKKDLVVYFNFKEYEETKIADNGEMVTEKRNIPFLRYYNVFNIKYVEGIESKVKETVFEHQPIEEAEKIFSAYITAENIKVNHIKGNKACYSPVSDSVTLPLMEQFKSVGHSTMKRLGRNENGFFGDEAYSKEELTAEMISSMLLAYCGINSTSTEKNNIAYMRSWLKALKDNTTWLVSACSKAQKATEYILSKSNN